MKKQRGRSRKDAKSKAFKSGLCDPCRSGHYLVGPLRDRTSTSCDNPETCTCIVCGKPPVEALLA